MAQKDQKEKDYIIKCKKEAEDASRDRRKAQKELWNLFQNKQDWSAKEDWQARVFIPKLFMTVMQAASTVKRAVMFPRKLFKMTPKYRDDTEAEKAGPHNEEKLKIALLESNFINTYSEMIIGAFLTGFGSVKPLWNNGLLYSNVDVANLFIDPTYEPHQKAPPKYIIEREVMDLAALKLVAKQVNKQGRKQIYKLKELKKIESDHKESDVFADERKRRGISDYQTVDKKVELLHFWGDLTIDEKIKENQLRLLANDQYIIREQNNPFEHGRPPYILTIPIVYPHRGIAGIALAEPMVTLQYAYNNIVNMAIDNLNFSVNKIFEANIGNIVNPRNLTKIYPGKVIKKQTMNRAVEEVRTSSLGQDVFSIFDFMGREIEKATGVTEFIMGASGKSKTATEAELKTAQAQGLFDVIARDIEVNSLGPLIEMSFDLMMQFGDIDPTWRGRYDFKVGGLSLLLVQREQVQRMGEVLSLALKSKDIGQMTDLPSLYKKLLNIYNLDDVYSEKPQRPNIEQRQGVQARAAEDARKAVSQMSPEQIMAAG